MVEPAENAEIAALRLALAAAEQRADLAELNATRAQAEVARARAEKTDGEAEIARLKLEIEKLRRSLYGQRSERKARLLDQLEFELEDLEATATEDELAAEMAAAKTTPVRAFTRKRAQRRAFPEHLPRERVVVPAPEACACCGSGHLVKLGEDVTETLEVIPRQWKVVQTVREKFSCRACEKISQPPAPFHPTPRGFAGPNLLATILFEKFGQHQPLNRQSERFAREGVPISLSTLADQVGAATVALQPLHDLIADHVMAADRLHGDDTTVPILAKGKTMTGRVWTYVRDDRPFGGTNGPAALFFASPDRRGEHPRSHLAGYSGILQVDAFAGYNGLFDPERRSDPIRPAFCWAHGRRPLFELADIEKVRKKNGKGGAISPVALEAVRRIDEIFAIERDLHGQRPEQRLAERQRLPSSSRPSSTTSILKPGWPTCSPASPTCRRTGWGTASLELGDAGHDQGRLIVQRNKVYAVKTIDRVAAELGETVDRIFEITIEMETEHGVIRVYSLADDGGTIGFTEDGIECLRNLIEEHQSAGL